MLEETKVSAQRGFVAMLKEKKKNSLIFVLLLVTIALSSIVIRLENQRYALLVGMCPNAREFSANPTPEALGCLRTVQTRTSSLWHLYYAIADSF